MHSKLIQIGGINILASKWATDVNELNQESNDEPSEKNTICKRK